MTGRPRMRLGCACGRRYRLGIVHGLASAARRHGFPAPQRRGSGLTSAVPHSPLSSHRRPLPAGNEQTVGALHLAQHKRRLYEAYVGGVSPRRRIIQ